MYCIWSTVYFLCPRFGLLGPGSSDSLLGPKDSQKGSSALLDAKEFLKHFTSDGMPTGELQPLAVNRGYVHILNIWLQWALTEAFTSI